MNKKYLIGIYKISKQNNYIVAHALYSYEHKPVEWKVYALFWGWVKPFGLNPTSKQGIYFHFLTERWCTHLRAGLMSAPDWSEFCDWPITGQVQQSLPNWPTIYKFAIGSERDALI